MPKRIAEWLWHVTQLIDITPPVVPEVLALMPRLSLISHLNPLLMLFAGLGTASNQFMQEGMSEEARRGLLMEYTDQLRLSMAANLQDYHMHSFQVIPCLQILCIYIFGSWSGL